MYLQSLEIEMATAAMTEIAISVTTAKATVASESLLRDSITVVVPPNSSTITVGG
jgi:hypothetical protein